MYNQSEVINEPYTSTTHEVDIDLLQYLNEECGYVHL